LSATNQSGLPPTDWLDDLTVWRTTSLRIERRLSVGEKSLVAPLETAVAKLDRQTNRLLVLLDAADERLWTAVARELALALSGGGPPGMLALGVKEALAAASYAAAAQVLTELGL
jgi:predicted oxidoreductase (fatty acid repression mutant protein)